MGMRHRSWRMTVEIQSEGQETGNPCKVKSVLSTPLRRLINKNKNGYGTSINTWSAEATAWPSMEEVNDTAGTRAEAKAVGTGSLRSELLKLGRSDDSAIPRCLNIIVLTAWCQEIVPQKYQYTIIKVLYEKNYSEEPGSYCGISLGSGVGKVVLKTAATGIRACDELKGVPTGAQCGCRPGR